MLTTDDTTTQDARTAGRSQSAAGHQPAAHAPADEQAAPPPTVATHMRAITQHRYGGPDQLELDRVPVPSPAADQVLIAVDAAGVDRGTWHLMTGLPRLVRLGFGFRGPKQPIPGLDVAGSVISVGAEVTRFAPGDQVFGIAAGSFAEFAVADESKLAMRPANVRADDAAAARLADMIPTRTEV